MWARLFGRKPALEKLQPANVRILCDDKTYNVIFEDSDFTVDEARGRSGVTLGFLKSKLEPIIGSRVDIYQLRPKRRLSDNDMYLADYEVYTDDRLVAIAKQKKEEAESKPGKSKRGKKKGKKGKSSEGANKQDGTSTASAPTSTPPPPTPPPKPLSPREQIQNIMDDVNENIKPHVDKFVANPPEAKAEREDIHRRLGETILQKMLKLDDVVTDGDDELRTLRKQAINSMHNYHEALDEAFKAAQSKEE